jgi:hypothetical protein
VNIRYAYLSILLLLTACSAVTPASPEVAGRSPATAVVPPSASPQAATISTTTPSAAGGAAATPAPAGDEATAVKSVVERFGKTLQKVSLQAPPDTVTQEIQQQYAAFVAPGLLERWLADPRQAPGRVVSSPWPDRIEVSNIAKTGDHAYRVQGNIVDITSAEMAHGGAASKERVQMSVELIQGRWVITEYARLD